MIGKAYLNLQDAETILTKYYEKEYERFTDFEIQFDVEERCNTSRDWDGSYDYYKTNEICALIKLKRKIGDIVTSFEVKKDKAELTQDLLNELKKLYQDEEFDVSDLYFPTFKRNVINLKEKVSLYFKDKKNIKLEKRIG